MENDSPVWAEGRFIPLRRNGGMTGAWWTLFHCADWDAERRRRRSDGVQQEFPPTR